MCALPAGYAAHLFRLEESLGGTLASLHNMRFYARLARALRPVARIDLDRPARPPQSPR
jgi:queuine/archaeosine tRNA-ribosyltransferase